MSLRWSLFEAPFAAGEVGQETEVAEDLELLADFIFNVAIVGMKFYKNCGVKPIFLQSSLASFRAPPAPR
jgi:hypothetical protein